jgi:hypothetical protein
MGSDDGPGVFLSLADCISLYPGLKNKEASLLNKEREILIRMEKVLYGSLSIHEIGELLEGKAGL